MTIEQRIERLERENRRIRLFAAVLLATLLASALVAALPAPQVANAQAVEKQLRAKGLYQAKGGLMLEVNGISVVDEKNRVRARLTSHGLGI